MEKYTTKNPKETQKWGEDLAREILSSIPKKSAVVLGLQGDLGSGKTTFLQGFAKGLGVTENVLSPTFVIMKKFQIPQNKKVPKNSRPSVLRYFYHFDCYRLNEPEEILQLGFEEIITDPKNIVAIEWPEKIAKILPRSSMQINFRYLGENKRGLTVSR